MAMGSMGGGNAKKGSTTAEPYINVTPLIDVLLVLLIIFMVVTPLKPSRFQADIPTQRDPNEDLSQLKPNPLTLVVSIAPDLSIKLNADSLGSVHFRLKPRRPTKVPTAVAALDCREFLRNRVASSFAVFKIPQKSAILSNWHACCYYCCVHLVPLHEGAVQRFSGPAAPPLPFFRLRRRPVAAARRSRTSPS